jgi:hypothetical protein
MADMSLRPRPTVTALAAILAAGVLLAGCGDLAAPTDSTGAGGSSGGPISSGRGAVPTPDATALADAAALGRWRPAPIAPSPGFAGAAEAACRATGSVGDLPLAVLDARGEGLATLVFATDQAAVLCRAAVDAAGSATATAREVRGIAGTTPPPTRTLGIHDLEAITDDAIVRTVVVGQVGDGVSHVSVNFGDATWSQATMANGWYATWWPSTKEALGVAAVDNRNVVIISYAP